MFEIDIQHLGPEAFGEWINLLNEAQIRCPGYVPVTIRSVHAWPMCGDFPPEETFLASLGGLPIGAISFSLKGNRGILSHFVVLQGFRRQGIGGRLLEAALQELVRRGAEEVLAVCWAFEPYAKFFAKFGFSPRTRYLKVVWDLPGLPPSPPQGEIREASPEDLPALTNLCAQSYLPEWAWLWPSEEKLKASVQNLFSAAFSQPERRRVLVAVQDGCPIGVTCPWVDESFVAETGIQEGMLVLGVGVLPEYRKKGIGTSLLRAALDHLRGWGMKYGSVWTIAPMDSDSPALTFYRTRGGTVTVEWMVLSRKLRSALE
ncbi:MAG: GNAT family N-acetyltransferase [Armatimonadota bacterium]|nr:GNAT family N-acetyltransferase [Armatimonadota bacterium]